MFAETKNKLAPELSAINNLIDITKKNVETQEKIKEQIISYQKVNKEFLKQPENEELLYQTIICADRLLDDINHAYITQIFSPEFLKELKLFSQIAKNQGVRKP
jgi:hypothetical protein